MENQLQKLKGELINKSLYLGESAVGDYDNCLIAYQKKFRLSWFATQLNTFYIIHQYNGAITKEVIEDFSGKSVRFAFANNKGWPRGLQAAVASISVLVGDDVKEDAIHFCQHPSKKHWSGFEIPVILDTKNNKTYFFEKNPLWGRIYFPYFKKLITADINLV